MGGTTLSDVAVHAGVSVATASRALNGSSRVVNGVLAQRVADSARTLDYRADASAQAMARGRTDVVGLLVTTISDPYFSAIADGVLQVAEARGLTVTIAATHGDPDREADHVAGMRAQRARALVLVGSRVSGHEGGRSRLATAIGSFERTGGRVAVVSQRRLPVDTVVIGNRAGARRLAERLVDLGHRRFGVLAGGQDLLTSRDRVAGFSEGLRAAGGTLAPEHLLHTAFTRDGGHAGAGVVVEQGWGVDCLFAVNDVMAVGAMAALRERGWRVPGRLAVAGFDDIDTLRDVTPSLTTVHLPLVEIGRQALTMALSGTRPGGRTRRVSGEVVLRESTARDARRPPLPP